MRFSLLVPVLGLLCGSPLSAQSSGPRALCFQPGPLPQCRASWITEFGGGRLLASNRQDHRSPHFQWNLGAVKNLSPRASLGGAAFLTWSDGATTIGVAPRFRYWATPRLSFDVAPGLVVFQGGSRNIGFNGQLAANVDRHVALTTTVQVTNAGVFVGDEQLRRVEWYAGARLNGKVGAISGVAAPILAFLVYLLWYNEVSN